MEKSIETIWKEGFLKSDALVAPKLNDLYNQKSIHIVDKFKRMYRINRIAIVVFAFIVLPVSFISGMPYVGILMFILFNFIVIVSGKFKRKLEKIAPGVSSYQYLSSFDTIIKDLVRTNTKLSRYFYPYIFITILLGFWFGDIGGNIPGEEFVAELLIDYPDMHLIFGLPLYGVLGALLILLLLAFFGGKIGQWDLNLVYSGIIKKLEKMILEMEELRA